MTKSSKRARFEAIVDSLVKWSDNLGGKTIGKKGGPRLGKTREYLGLPGEVIRPGHTVSRQQIRRIALKQAKAARSAGV